MRLAGRIFALIGLATTLGGAIALAYFIGGGVSATPQPGDLETLVARTVRDIAIEWHAPEQQNPLPDTDDVLAEGRAHFADHCAVCHGNDGSGNTDIGRGLYPRAPDMRLAATQDLSDHQLLYIIEHGIRLTGMPGFGTGTPESELESWPLVRFIRHLPDISESEIEEMEDLNPRSRAEVLEEIEVERFLRGDDIADDADPAEPGAPAHAH